MSYFLSQIVQETPKRSFRCFNLDYRSLMLSWVLTVLFTLFFKGFQRKLWMLSKRLLEAGGSSFGGGFGGDFFGDCLFLPAYLTGKGMPLPGFDSSLYLASCFARSIAQFFCAMISFFFCRNLFQTDISLILLSQSWSCLPKLFIFFCLLPFACLSYRDCGFLCIFPSLLSLNCLILSLLCRMASQNSISSSYSSDLSSTFSPCFTVSRTNFNRSSISIAKSSRYLSATMLFFDGISWLVSQLDCVLFLRLGRTGEFLLFYALLRT